MKSKKQKTFIVTVRVVSEYGKPPDVRCLCGDTVFIRMDEGQSASWSIKRAKRKK